MIYTSVCLCQIYTLNFTLPVRDLLKYINSYTGRKNPVDANEILYSISQRFVESLEKYRNLSSAEKGKIPVCLKEALDRWLFILLRKDKTPNTRLDIYWRVEQKYKDVLLPTDCSWYFISKGIEGGNGDSTHDAGRIEIVDAFREYYRCNSKNHVRHKTISILFHELIHEVKKVLPKCFASLSRGWEEATTEDIEVLIFRDDAGNGYEIDGINPHGYDATCKRVCKECDSCPKCQDVD